MGKAATSSGQALIDQLSAKFADDFRSANSRRQGDMSVRNKLITAGAWLFGAAPDQIRTFAAKNFDFQQSINAAGRVFSQPDEVRLFFSALEKRAWEREDEDRWLTIQWIWSARRILSGHESAAANLDREQVVQLYYFLFDDLWSWIENEQVNGFVATLWVLLYLLRYRVVEGSFLAPDSKKDKELGNAFDEAIIRAESGISGRSTFLTRTRQRVALEILTGIKEFREFRGSMNIVTKLTGLEEDDLKEDE